MKALAVTPSLGALTPDPSPRGRGEDSLLSPGEGGRRSRPDEGGPDEGIDTLDWPTIERDLDAYGCAIAPKLLSPETCRELQALYPEDTRFRSRVVMAKHGFGKGEYKYFAYPLPEPIVALRRGLLCEARAARGPVERGDGRRRPLPRRARSVPCALP